MRLRIAWVIVLAQLAQLALLQAQQTDREHWVATWVTAQNIVRNPPPAARPPVPAAPAAPAAPPRPMGIRGFNNQTIRMTVRTSIGGRRMRIKLANAYGSVPVTVGAAHVAYAPRSLRLFRGRTARWLSMASRAAPWTRAW